MNDYHAIVAMILMLVVVAVIGTQSSSGNMITGNFINYKRYVAEDFSQVREEMLDSKLVQDAQALFLEFPNMKVVDGVVIPFDIQILEMLVFS